MWSCILHLHEGEGNDFCFFLQPLAGRLLYLIGRGSVIDEPALIAALHSGKLGGAALDVFANEPLAAESPLWTLPNVLISPHSAAPATVRMRGLPRCFAPTCGAISPVNHC